MIKKTFLSIGLLSGFAFANEVLAHASIQAKDNLDSYSGRSYEEGTTAFINVHLSHGCTSEDGTEVFATRNVTMVLPNSNDLSGIAYTGHGAGRLAGNAVMGVSPRVDNDWAKIKRFKSTVPTYDNHGPKSTDTRAVHWLRGNVPYDMYENLEFKATLPKLDACVSKLRVYVPVVQYCKGGGVLAWLREPTPSFGEDVISAGYSLSFDVVRNEASNPLPDSCGGVGTQESVYPSVEDIEAYLPLKTRKMDSDD